MEQCSWIDEDTDTRCETDCEQICACCSMPLCHEHQSQNTCPFGGQGMIEV